MQALGGSLKITLTVPLKITLTVSLKITLTVPLKLSFEMTAAVELMC